MADPGRLFDMGYQNMIEEKMFRFATDSFAEYDAIVCSLVLWWVEIRQYEYES